MLQDALATGARRAFGSLLAGLLCTGTLVATATSASAAEPRLSVSDVVIVEGDSGKRVANFRVTLSEPAPTDVLATFSTYDDGATGGVDYMARVGRPLKIRAGAVQRAISVPIYPDTLPEPDEAFGFLVTDIVGAEAHDPDGRATILDDDPGSGFRIAIGDASIVEGDVRKRTVAVPVTLSEPAPTEIVLGLATADGSATGAIRKPTVGDDFRHKGPTAKVKFRVGQRHKFVTVPILPDTAAESDETFTVTISGSSDIVRPTGTVTIRDDDTTAASATTTTLSSAPNPSAFGEDVTLTATVGSASGSPAGTVEFFDGASSLGDASVVGGAATLVTNVLTVGVHSLSAQYSGSPTHLASSGGTSHEVVLSPVSVVLSSDPNPSDSGQAVQLDASLTTIGTATGTVEFFDGTDSLGAAPVSANAASLVVSDLPFGSRTLRASYGGDATHAAATSSDHVHEVQALSGPGSLSGWGDNSDWQVGDGGTTTPRLTPSPVAATGPWVEVAGGAQHSLAIATDGSLWAWGRNFGGELGDGTTDPSPVPAQVGTATDWVAVAAGSGTSFAVKSDGTMWAWGFNLFGSLGTGDTVSRLVPTQIGSATDWSSVSTKTWSVVAIKTDGTLWTWGVNSQGQLGTGDTSARLQPVHIGSTTSWVEVSSGDFHTVARRADGTLWAWGGNGQGQLGDGTSVTKTSPTMIGVATDWVDVAAGFEHTLAIRSDGSLYAWGSNANGQIGDGGTLTVRLSPVRVGVDNDWAEVAAGADHSLARRAGGEVWSWGSNFAAQLGDGTTIDRNSPNAVSGLQTATRLAAGHRHSLAILG